MMLETADGCGGDIALGKQSSSQALVGFLSGRIILVSSDRKLASEVNPRIAMRG